MANVDDLLANKTQDEGYSSVFPSPVKKCQPMTFDFTASNADQFISSDDLAELLKNEFKKDGENSCRQNDLSVQLRQSTTCNNDSAPNGNNNSAANVFFLDCRNPFEFEHLHIKNSINIVVPSILYKRLVKGTLSTPSLISSENYREAFGRAYKSSLIVIIQETAPLIPSNQNCRNGLNNVKMDDSSSVSPLLCKKLREEGCDARYIQGGLNAFYLQYPDFCQTSSSLISTLPSSSLLSFDNNQNHNQPPSIDIENNHNSTHTFTSSLASNRRKFSASERPSSLYYLDMKSLKLDDCGSSSSGDDSASTSGYSVSSCSTAASSCCSGDSSCYMGGVCPASAAATPDDPLLSSTNPVSSNSDVFERSGDEMAVASQIQTQCNQNEQNNHYQHHYLRQDAKFPVEIIPHLFLGNSMNSTDREILRKYNIKYILNVTPDLPNVFENDQFFRYLQIPIYDHWSQDLMVHFPAAINFIDEARQQHCGVLVHCLAGISRSVTVTVAYLMRTLSLCLEDAYDLVKNHKPNIAPNLNFMGQLLDFQRDLYGDDPPANNTCALLRTPSTGGDRGLNGHSMLIHPDSDGHMDDPMTSQFPPAPLSAPPQRRDPSRRTKQLAECF